MVNQDGTVEYAANSWTYTLPDDHCNLLADRVAQWTRIPRDRQDPFTVLRYGVEVGECAASPQEKVFLDVFPIGTLLPRMVW